VFATKSLLDLGGGDNLILKHTFLKFVKIRKFLRIFKIRKIRILNLWITGSDCIVMPRIGAAFSHLAPLPPPARDFTEKELLASTSAVGPISIVEIYGC